MRISLTLNADGYFWWIGGLIGGVALQTLFQFQTIWEQALGIGVLVLGATVFDAGIGVVADAMTNYQRKRRAQGGP